MLPNVRFARRSRSRPVCRRHRAPRDEALLVGACIMRRVMSAARLGEIISLAKEYAEGKGKKERRSINPHRTAFGGGYPLPAIAARILGLAGYLASFLVSSFLCRSIDLVGIEQQSHSAQSVVADFGSVSLLVGRSCTPQPARVRASPSQHRANARMTNSEIDCS